MPTEPQTPTFAQVVRVAAETADPAGADQAVADLVLRFEDRDEPITSVADVEEELAEARAAIDLDGDSERLATAVAVATYLAFKRGEIGADRDELIRLATRAEDVA
jgi:hypothetical protein